MTDPHRWTGTAAALPTFESRVRRASIRGKSVSIEQWRPASGAPSRYLVVVADNSEEETYLWPDGSLQRWWVGHSGDFDVRTFSTVEDAEMVILEYALTGGG